jgi:lysophospholipase L1-like esterase
MIICLILAEFAARMFFPQFAPSSPDQTGLWAYNELLGWSHTPGRQSGFIHRDFSVEVSINSLGLRDSEYTLERTGSKRRMLVIGDSFGWGFGVSCHERFSEILEADHPDWEVINASVAGYSTDQQLLYLRESGLALTPDIVLLLVCGNDFDENTRREVCWYGKPRFTLEGETLRLQNTPVPRGNYKQRFNRYFFNRTYILSRAYYYALLTGNAVTRLFTTGSPGANDRTKAPDERYMNDLTHQLIRAMDGLARANGAEFIIVSVPMGEERRAGLQDLALREGIPYLPLDGFFSKQEGSMTFPHDPHWTSAGHAVAAAAIEGFLQDLGVF